MEVQAIDVDDIRRFLEGEFDVAVFPHSVPNSVRPGFFVEDTVIAKSLLGFDDRFERLVLDLDEVSGIVGEARGLGDYGRDRLTPRKGLPPRPWKGAQFLCMGATEFRSRVGLRG